MSPWAYEENTKTSVPVSVLHEVNTMDNRSDDIELAGVLVARSFQFCFIAWVIVVGKIQEVAEVKLALV